jgi:hypothetical protein
VIDAVELLKQGAGAGFVGDIERDCARAAPELGLGPPAGDRAIVRLR